MLDAPAEEPHGAVSAPGAPIFRWVRALGLVREDGWIGGVCAAIADHVGVDPLVVRGAAVVTTVLGFPVLWLYAIAWALLPGPGGRIPLQLGRGSAPALAGAGATFGAAVLVLWVGNSFLEALAGLSSPGRLVWTLLEVSLWLAALGAVATGVILSVRRRQAQNLPRSGGDGEVSGAAAVGGAASGAAPPPFLSAPEPPEPLADELGSAEELEAWRRRHAAWREQHEQWRLRQVDGDRLAHAEERERRREEAAAFRAEAARLRALRRAARPRTSPAFVAIAAGSALIIGTGMWLAFQPYASERAMPAALLTAAAVFAVAMVIAGALRLRSGLLAAATIGALILGGSALLADTLDDLALPGAVRMLPPGDHEILQPFGDLQLDPAGWIEGTGTTTIEKGSGTTFISVQDGVDVDLRARLGDGAVYVTRYDDRGAERTEQLSPRGGVAAWSYDGTAGRTERTILLDQARGDVHIQVWED